MATNALTGTPLASQEFVWRVLGPAIVGWTVQLLLAGFAGSMLISYLGSELYKTDSRRLKLLLLWVVSMLALHSGISYYSVWHYSTWQKRDVDTLFSETVADCLSTLPIGLMGTTVQIFLSVRAGALFQKKWTKGIYYTLVGLTTGAGLAGALMFLGIAIRLRAGTYDYKTAFISFSDAIGLFLWGCAAADILISVTLCMQLWHHFGGHMESRPIMKRLMSVAIQSASFTALVALIGAILSHTFASDSLDADACVAFYQPLSSLYAISFLITLSSRPKTQRIINDTRALFHQNQKFPVVPGGDPFMRLPEETIRMTPLGRSMSSFTSINFEPGLESEREEEELGKGTGRVHY